MTFGKTGGTRGASMSQSALVPCSTVAAICAHAPSLTETHQVWNEKSSYISPSKTQHWGQRALVFSPSKSFKLFCLEFDFWTGENFNTLNLKLLPTHFYSKVSLDAFLINSVHRNINIAEHSSPEHIHDEIFLTEKFWKKRSSVSWLFKDLVPFKPVHFLPKIFGY